MFRAVSITLALMGGGAAVGAAALHDHRACTDARAAHRSDADQICAGSHGTSAVGSHGGGFYGGGTSTAAATTVARGGFGAAGAHAGAGS
jgi:hypothetical protein